MAAVTLATAAFALPCIAQSFDTSTAREKPVKRKAQRDILGGSVQAAPAPEPTFQGANLDGVKPATLNESCDEYGAGRKAVCRKACPWDADPARDDDFARNCGEIVKAGLKFRSVRFEEGGRPWHLQIGINPAKPDGPLWFVPHDNEDVAFDTAIYALTAYGGRLVKVDAKGQRENRGQDPNRNFQVSGAKQCRDQRALSPVYTRAVMDEWDGIRPLIALHSNKPGGTISIRSKAAGVMAFPGSVAAKTKFSLFRPDNTLVFLSASSDSDRTKTFRRELNKSGVNVVEERVDRQTNDCSLSNYAVLTGIENYFNVEVSSAPKERGSTSEEAQKAIVDLIMQLPNLNNERARKAASY
jgi:hypothetical protein